MCGIAGICNIESTPDVLAGILSSQIIHEQFVETFPTGSIPVVDPDIVIDKRSGARPSVAGMPSRRRPETTSTLRR